MAQKPTPPKRVRKNLPSLLKGTRGQVADLDAFGCTPKQAAFVREFLICNIGTEAARRVSPNSKRPNILANQWMRLPNVMAAIKAGRELTSKRARMTLDDVVRGLEEIAQGNLDDFMSTDPKTNRKYVDWTKIDALPEEERRAKMAALGELTVETMGGGVTRDGAQRPVVLSTKLKLTDRKGALVDLGKHLGGFVSRGELTGPNGGPVPVAGAFVFSDDPQQAAKAYQQMITREKK